MKHFVAPVFLCSGIYDKLCVGVVFFKGEAIEKIFWNNSKIKEGIKLFRFPKSVTLSSIKFGNNPAVSRTYWDKHLVSHSNGMVRYGATKPYAWKEGLNYRKFANVLMK